MHLIKLQKEREIVIKRCDKGAGVIILNFKDYMSACYGHLNLKLKLENGSTQDYYTKVDKNAFNVAKTKLKHVLEEGLDNKVITNLSLKPWIQMEKVLESFTSTLKSTKHMNL